jgi:DNA-binding PadR family transcriptional regulator
MQKTDTLGHFEERVLAAVKTAKNAWAVPIQDHVEAIGGKRVQSAAIYVTVQRLESKGYVLARNAEHNGKSGKQSKRFYSITASGKQALEESIACAVRLLEFLKVR